MEKYLAQSQDYKDRKMAERSDAIFSLFGYTPATMAAQRAQQEEQMAQSAAQQDRQASIAGIQQDIRGYASLFGFETPAMKQAKANEAITKSFLLEQDPQARMDIVRTATERDPALGIQLRQIMLQEAAAKTAADLAERKMRVEEIKAEKEAKGTPAVVGLLSKGDRTSYEKIMDYDPSVKAEIETIDTKSSWNPFSDAPTDESVKEVLMNRAQEIRANNKGMGAPTALRIAAQEYKGMTGGAVAPAQQQQQAPARSLVNIQD